MNLEDFNDLDFNAIGDWPPPVKAILVVLICALVAGAWYYLDTEPQWVELDQLVNKEHELRTNFEGKQMKAANLNAYREQLAEMEESFGAMLRQLPDKTQVAELLVDVSQTGLAAGLEFDLFEPKAEEPRDFYAELPISIKVTGTYHKFGEFVSGLAALPRIVTIHDIQITPLAAATTAPRRDNAKDSPLTLSATAKTYRYLEGKQ